MEGNITIAHQAAYLTSLNLGMAKIISTQLYDHGNKIGNADFQAD